MIKLISAVERSLQEEGETNAKVKAYLTQRYQNRLDQKLAGRQPINLCKIPSSEGTSEETSSYFVSINHDDVQGTIQNIFEEAKGRLLITGVPGSGKTVLMLQLVLALLKKKTPAIPVILNLATWQSGYIKLENWLEEILPAELGINSAFAKKIRKEIPLILLLDGLDEVKEENRKSCLDAIGLYGADAQKQFAIASRKQEYMEVGKDAPVYLQVEVEPLQLEQIEEELNRIGYRQPEALPLLKAIKTDAVLREAVTTPFYFNVLQLLFAQGKRLSDLNFSSNHIEGLRKEIIQRFINTQLNEKAFGSKPVQKWLAFLASRMTQRNLVVFELRDLQYDWQSWSKKNLFFGGFFHSLFMMLLVLIVVSSFFGILSGSIQESDYFVFLLVAILLLSLVQGLKSSLRMTLDFKIETKDRINFTWKLFWETLLDFSLGGVLLFGPFAGLAVGLYTNLVTGLIAGLASGLLSGLIIGLGHIFRKEYSSFLQINRPYQRFYASMYSLHFSIFKHLLLRYLLYQEGLLPLKLVRFLNEMTKQHILESDGAAWRFRHRIIQDYFAEQWEEWEETK